MTADNDRLAIESQSTFLVYNEDTGEIVHIHRMFIHQGADALKENEGETRALEIAGRFNASGSRLAVMATDEYDSSKPHRVDVKTRRLVAEGAA